MLNITIFMEMQIETTMKYYSTLIRMGISKIQEKNQVLLRMWKNWNICSLLVEIKMVKLLWKTLGQLLKKFKWITRSFISSITPQK